MSRYSEEITKAMNFLAEDQRVIFLGQSVAYPGHIMTETLKDIPLERKIELPVFEDVQLGISTGLALAGYLPVSIYPRLDFLIIAVNQLVNHLDKLSEMSAQQFNPKVIIRTMVGSNVPLQSGPQHTQDHTEALRKLVTNIDIYRLETYDQIMPAYQAAYAANKSSILIEAPPLRSGYEEVPLLSGPAAFQLMS